MQTLPLEQEEVRPGNVAGMGLPALISTQADNQVPIAATLHELGAVINLGMVDNPLPQIIVLQLSALTQPNK